MKHWDKCGITFQHIVLLCNTRRVTHVRRHVLNDFLGVSVTSRVAVLRAGACPRRSEFARTNDDLHLRLGTYLHSRVHMRAACQRQKNDLRHMPCLTTRHERSQSFLLKVVKKYSIFKMLMTGIDPASNGS